MFYTLQIFFISCPFSSRYVFDDFLWVYSTVESFKQKLLTWCLYLTCSKRLFYIFHAFNNFNIVPGFFNILSSETSEYFIQFNFHGNSSP